MRGSREQLDLTLFTYKNAIVVADFFGNCKLQFSIFFAVFGFGIFNVNVR